MRAHLKIGDNHYILSEAWPRDTGYENMLFACDSKGEIEDYADLWVSYDLDFDKSIEYLKDNPEVIQDEQDSTG